MEGEGGGEVECVNGGGGGEVRGEGGVECVNGGGGGGEGASLG